MPPIESPSPPGLPGVVGPVGSFHQQLRASALKGELKALMPVPLPSNEFGERALLRIGLSNGRRRRRGGVVGVHWISKTDTGAIGNKTRFCELNDAKRIHVRANDVACEFATIHIQPIVSAYDAETGVLDVAIFQTATRRGIDVKKHPVPRLTA
jgi:hypothetical protein